MTASEGWQSETLVTDAIGQLMEFWGFKRNMGRVWAMLYLSAIFCFRDAERPRRSTPL